HGRTCFYKRRFSFLLLGNTYTGKRRLFTGFFSIGFWPNRCLLVGSLAQHSLFELCGHWWLADPDGQHGVVYAFSFHAADQIPIKGYFHSLSVRHVIKLRHTA